MKTIAVNRVLADGKTKIEININIAHIVSYEQDYLDKQRTRIRTVDGEGYIVLTTPNAVWAAIERATKG